LASSIERSTGLLETPATHSEDILEHKTLDTSEVTTSHPEDIKFPMNRPRSPEWELHKAEIRQLYIIEKRNLQDLIETMHREYDFTATLVQLVPWLITLILYCSI